MTILDPVVASNLTVYLLQLPRSRPATRKQSAALPVEFLTLEPARTSGEITLSEISVTERVRVESCSSRDIFLQAGEMLRGGLQDRAVATDLIVPAPRHEPEGQMVPVFSAEEQRWEWMPSSQREDFDFVDQIIPGRKLKLALRLGTQDDVWREVAALTDNLTDFLSHGGARPAPRYSLCMLIEVLETLGWLKEYIHPLLHLAEANLDATGAVFVVDGKINNAEMYATPALFRQMWPKLVWAMSVEALVERHRNAATPQTGEQLLPTKGEVTAWLATVHARRAARHTDIVTKRTHRRIRSIGSQICFETLDEEQGGLCIHESVLSNE